jgi:hypothetical protein
MGFAATLLAVLSLLAVLGLPPSGVAPAAATSPRASPAHGPATAPAAKSTAGVRVELESVTPGVARPGTRITVRGTLRNLGTDRIDVPVVRLHRTTTGLDTRGAVASWANGSSQLGPGVQIAQRVLKTPLMPRATLPFTITVPKDAIQTGYRFTTLGLTLEVRRGQRADAATVGRLRTFLPWDSAPASDHHPIEIGWVVPLTLPAEPELFGPESDERAAAWERALGTGSRIDQLITATTDEPVTWAVDPTAVEAPPSQNEFQSPTAPPTTTPAPTSTGSSSPTTSGTSTGSPTTSPSSTAGTSSTSEQPSTSSSPSTTTSTTGTSSGPSSSGATTAPSSPPSTTPGPAPTTPPPPSEADLLSDQLADRLRTAGGTHPLWALPYGDPDLSALLHLDPRGATLRAALATKTPKSLGKRTRSGIAWPIDPRLGDKTVATLRGAWRGHGGLAAAVISARALDGSSGYTGSAPRKSAQGLPLLAYDDRLSGIFSAMDDPAAGGAAVQRFLAETLAVYQERPANSRSLLVVPPRTFEGDPTVLRQLFAGVDRAPWLRATSTDTLLRQAKKAPKVKDRTLTGKSAPAAPGSLAAYPSAHASPLTTKRLLALTELRATTAGVSGVLDPGDGYRSIWSAATDQLLSSRWRTRPGAWRTLEVRVVDANQAITKGVSVVSSPFNFFADEGSLQLTVVNDLDVSVRNVHLTLAPRNPRLRIIAQPTPLRIGPHSRTTVKVKVNAISAGLVPVDAYLSAPNGTTLGSGASVTVRVQPTSTWIYWVLGIVAGLILVIGLYRALRRGGQRPTDPSAAEHIQEIPDP